MFRREALAGYKQVNQDEEREILCAEDFAPM
jgi:hypothetical protein